jgi:uncharacterized protein with gpF-like domain
VDAARIVADFMAKFPAGIDPAQAEQWLTAQGIGAGIAAALLPVLEQMWMAAAQAGVKAASLAAGTQQQLSQQEYQDLIAQMQRQWLQQITATTLALLASALATAATFTVTALSAALVAALDNANRAKQIAMTEITRLMALAAQKIYQLAGVIYVRWVTEHDAKVCPACETNQAAGKWPLGVPFPSGAPQPPDHVNCRCALVPA